MGCPTRVNLGDDLTFSVCTHNPETAILTDADDLPSYRIYKNEGSTPILSGQMEKLDDPNTTGFYTKLIECTIANGFEDEKTYTIYITASVISHRGGIPFSFRISSSDIAEKVEHIEETLDENKPIFVNTNGDLEELKL